MRTTLQKNMILDVSKAIEENTALFYQQKIKEGYEMLENTLALIVQTTNVIFNLQTDKIELNINQGELNVVLSNAMNAIENGDTISLSDILYFDLKPLLEQTFK